MARWVVVALVSAGAGFWILGIGSAAESGAAEAVKEMPGLALTIAPAAEAPATRSDMRVARLVSLFVPAGDAPSALTPPGTFVAIWEGDLTLRVRDYYTFSAEGRGKLTVSVNGKPALEASGDDFSKASAESVRLNKNKNHFVARYESPASGDAAVRLFWTVKGENYPDPVPPTVFGHDVSLPGLAQSLLLRDGRSLFADLRCSKCHLATPPTAPGP